MSRAGRVRTFADLTPEIIAEAEAAANEVGEAVAFAAFIGVAESKDVEVDTFLEELVIRCACDKSGRRVFRHREQLWALPVGDREALLERAFNSLPGEPAQILRFRRRG